ncbi:hypothetical protein [Zunongwangia sp. SCSIO 43204]|uniref:hypothetical protein n=1 Tax=Zunongwangia sp. SCSIO 43204 TaxID=2779359 RepID=UPI001CA92569|nr:hypothetical protein [Zunongwangia sp. SCSIO 43204]
MKYFCVSYITFCLILVLTSFSNSCIAQADATVTVEGDIITLENYLGNGVQWDPYQLDYGKVELEISKNDWDKLYSRLDFMKPQVVRVMVNTTSSIINDTLNPYREFKDLKPILDYCQSRSVTVTFGDWGGGMVDSKAKTINEKNLRFAAQYLEFLVNTNNYSCIKYYNLINEPNGFWSSTDGNYNLWKNAMQFFYSEIEELDLAHKVKIMAPDIAIWKTDKIDWVSKSADDLEDAVGLYDIHTYPSKTTVNSGRYENIIRAYREAAPHNVPMIMGEIGFKFVEPEDSIYQKENIHRAKAKPYASIEDSQMFVYDFSYGIDMADALFQTVNAGYAGCVVWMLDDAMHSKESPNKLKVWGFWNILGEEYFGDSEEEVRPWYYAWSLLSKYMPQGSKILRVKTAGDPAIKAIALKYKGSYTIAIINISGENKKLNLVPSKYEGKSLFKKFVYGKNHLNKVGGYSLKPNDEIDLVFSSENQFDLPAESLTVLTNIK